MFRRGSKNGHEKDMCLERDWTACLECDHYYGFNSQHNWGQPIQAFNEHKNLHFDNALPRVGHLEKLKNHVRSNIEDHLFI